MAETPKQDTSTVALAGRLAREYVRPYVGWLAAAVACMMVVAATTMFTAWLMKPIVNEVFIGKKEALLWPIAGAVLATFFFKGLANYGQATLMNFVGQRIITDTQHRLYAHLMRMELAFFQTQPTGGLISRFTVDINMMRAAVSNAITGIGKDSLSLFFLVGLMVYQNPQLAVISLIVFPLAVLPISRLGRRIRKVTVNTQEEIGQLTTLLQQTFQGARVVKAYGMEDYEKGRVRALAERIFRLVFRAARVRALASPIMETLGGVAVSMVIVYGGQQVIDNEMDAGSFFSFITALLLAYEPLKRLANLNASLQEGLASAQRLFALLDTQPTINDKPDAKPLRLEQGVIKFSGLSFAYQAGHPALKGVTLEVPAGKLVALVGVSGAGKSTLLNLIPRFYDVDEGSVSIDGQDVRDVTMASLRASIALVSQEITLFDDSVRANIAYGRPDASEDDIKAAARNAAADEFIESFPAGYDTFVGEQGVAVSGGQRQRLAIARAMLKDAPILLLDEATSALDSQSERQVQSALKKLMKGRTTLVIAHRLSTVMDADMIHVIDRGRVVESGTHGELLARNGAYAHLHAMQFSQAPAAAVG